MLFRISTRARVWTATAMLMAALVLAVPSAAAEDPWVDAGPGCAHLAQAPDASASAGARAHYAAGGDWSLEPCMKTHQSAVDEKPPADHVFTAHGSGDDCQIEAGVFLERTFLAIGHAC